MEVQSIMYDIVVRVLVIAEELAVTIVLHKGVLIFRTPPVYCISHSMRIQQIFLAFVTLIYSFFE